MCLQEKLRSAYTLSTDQRTHCPHVQKEVLWYLLPKLHPAKTDYTAQLYRLIQLPSIYWAHSHFESLVVPKVFLFSKVTYVLVTFYRNNISIVKQSNVLC